MKYALLLALLLGGCAATPRGNAENACHFIFLAAIPLPLGAIGGAAACSFGLELMPDGDDEAPAPKKRVKPGAAKKPVAKMPAAVVDQPDETDEEEDDEDV